MLRVAPRFVLACVLLACGATLAACGDEAAPRADEPPREPLAKAPARATVEVPQDAPRVVFLGDSLSAGMQLGAAEAFPAVLQRELATSGTPFRLVNAGVSGSTTRAGLARLDWLLKQEPGVVVVQLGANDGFRGLELDETEKNLRAIVERARDAGARVLLLGMKLPPNYGADYTTQFESLFERIAEETEVAYVPFFMDGVAGVPAMNLADGIHPTAEGHRRLAANLRAPLRRVLEGR